MPRRDDIQKILLIGSGPIVIGQAAEFDYSGTQACRVLMDEGYEVVLVNSNPATIMTDPEVATTTYIEPLLPGPLAQVIEREQPDALLPTLGGQTALNLAKALHEDGTLERHGVELIGANYEAINRAEDRELFRDTMHRAGLRVPRSRIATSLTDAYEAATDLGLPMIVRPAFTLGGTGGGVVRHEAELETMVGRGLEASPIGQVLLEESVLGWGEFELEVMRDHTDNVVIVCSIENLDPMGVHTGDSVCVAPQQTLTDKQFQALRDQAITVIRAVGVETGGSNVQFAVNRETDEIVVIEMNPRVSRSSALASKATGFPIAKIAARLAVGYTLQEIPNDITRATPASFEPAIDYCVVKWPRFAFEKFPGAEAGLTTHMKSVGEAMAIGRTFKQAFAKALRSRELDSPAVMPSDDAKLLDLLRSPGAERFDYLLEALRRGAGVAEIQRPDQHRPVVPARAGRACRGSGGPVRRRADLQVGRHLRGRVRGQHALLLLGLGTAAPAISEIERGDRPSVVILGSGPNRIGQGIEFDYCCVHAAQTVREQGRDAVMINCNPETVSTDYDTSDRLYFEPLTLEDVLAVCRAEASGARLDGVIVQFGETPLKLAAGLAEAGIPISARESRRSTWPRTAPASGRCWIGSATRPRPTRPRRRPRRRSGAPPRSASPCWSARATCWAAARWRSSTPWTASGTTWSVSGSSPARHLPGPLPRGLDRGRRRRAVRWTARRRWSCLDRRDHATRRGGRDPLRDSACVLPPHALGEEMLAQIREQTDGDRPALGVVGLLNVQFAIHKEKGLHVIEANPRASRTVPFVSKAIGLPLAKLACRLILGERIADLDLPADPARRRRRTRVRQGGRAPIRPLRRRRLAAGTGDALDRRGDGDRPRLPHCVCQGPGGSGVKAADRWHGIHHRRRWRQAGGHRDRHPAARPGIRDHRHPRHRPGAQPDGDPGQGDQQDRRGLPACGRLDRARRGRAGDQYARRHRRADRRLRDPRRRGRPRIPCITTMAGGMAAARAIFAAARGEPAVISLQEIYAKSSRCLERRTRSGSVRAARPGR